MTTVLGGLYIIVLGLRISYGALDWLKKGSKPSAIVSAPSDYFTIYSQHHRLFHNLLPDIHKFFPKILPYIHEYSKIHSPRSQNIPWYTPWDSGKFMMYSLKSKNCPWNTSFFLLYPLLVTNKYHKWLKD